MHAGYWQRVWAAESNKAVKIATYLSALLSVFVMLMVGMIGWIAYSHYGANMAVGGAFEIAWLAVPWIVRDFMGAACTSLYKHIHIQIHSHIHMHMHSHPHPHPIHMHMLHPHPQPQPHPHAYAFASTSTSN